MKSLSRGVAAVTLGLLCVPALQAQGVFSLGGGIGIPMGNFNNAVKLGWHGVAGFSFVPTNSPVGVKIDGQYHQFKFDGQSSLKERMIFGTVNAVYKFQTSPESAIHPYLIGGGGVYNLKATGSADPGTVVSTTGSTTKFGLNGGVGLEFTAGSAGLFIEDRYHHVFTSGSSTSFMPISIGVRFGGASGG
jgi:opacity protein-like surface antigen